MDYHDLSRQEMVECFAFRAIDDHKRAAFHWDLAKAFAKAAKLTAQRFSGE